ncbi:MAG TPA: HlyD family efflux transporter periplasmic adaptor subunit [Methylibium sp.]|uniref:HlyD family efflux transporter periplasmic adaptor subunit n=1 Tax=Methylibium sp. TaxID=2067992 RepID=UPI002DBBD099|nr:HlyD family efflux transporter periplasmic adaptor subunit [Methylibium sp.]HEU4460760.1 HlyD family efflux transporter periplasmic adaptor subunit [Methylibium sp.]
MQDLALDSPEWHRVAALRPRLRAHLRVQRRVRGDEVWHLLIDPASGRFHRVNAEAWAFVGRLNGRDDVATLWQHAHQALGEAAPTQDDTVRLLAQLAEADLIAADRLPDLPLRAEQRRRHDRSQRRAAANPLAFRVPLADPSRWLDACAPLARALFSPPALALLALGLLFAGLAALGRAEPLARAIAAHGTSPSMLWSMWLAWPFVKALHEAGHALAVRAFGGEVKEVGVVLMALTPMPYVDASSASQFPRRRERVLVGAAGIGVELTLAALAFGVWAHASEPAWQQAALAVLLVTGLSTLLVNANPLMRYDGYHMLCDALDRPNLGAHADAAALGLLQRLLGLPRTGEAPARRREAIGLVGYAVAALAWRWSLGLALLHWLHAVAPPLALAAAACLGWMLVLRPARRLVSYLSGDARLQGRRLRAAGTVAALAAALLVLLAAAPAPRASVQQGVVWLPEHALLRAPADGLLRAVLAAPGSTVAAGTPVAALENLDLAAELEGLRARKVALDVGYFETLLVDPARAARLTEERGALDAREAWLADRLAALEVRAAVAGTLVLPRAGEREGHHFAQGSELGYVITPEPLLVRLALTEAQAAEVRAGTSSVRVRFAARPAGAAGHEWDGQIERITPAGTNRLPVAALGAAAGGPIATDPRDADGLATLAPVVLVDVRVPALAAGSIGMRAWVRFEHAPQPLAQQAATALRQGFLASLGSRD